MALDGLFDQLVRNGDHPHAVLHTMQPRALPSAIAASTTAIGSSASSISCSGRTLIVLSSRVVSVSGTARTFDFPLLLSAGVSPVLRFCSIGVSPPPTPLVDGGGGG